MTATQNLHLHLHLDNRPVGDLVPVTDLVPLDDIAGPDQPNGPWFTVLVAGSGWRSIVVLDQDGVEVEVACEPGQVVRRRLAS